MVFIGLDDVSVNIVDTFFFLLVYQRISSVIKGLWHFVKVWTTWRHWKDSSKTLNTLQNQYCIWDTSHVNCVIYILYIQLDFDWKLRPGWCCIIPHTLSSHWGCQVGSDIWNVPGTDNIQISTKFIKFISFPACLGMNAVILWRRNWLRFFLCVQCWKDLSKYLDTVKALCLAICWFMLFILCFAVWRLIK